MTTYIKTRKGMDELLARRNGIDARMNSALLFVDGKRSVNELHRLLKASGLPADTLDILLHGGFIIKAQPKTDMQSRPMPTLMSQPMVKAPANDGHVRPGSDQAFEAFQSLYTFMVKKSKVLLGLRGIAHQMRIERARDVAALIGLVNPMCETIAKRHGLQVANEFLRDLAQVVGRARLERHGLRLIADRRANSRAQFQTIVHVDESGKVRKPTVTRAGARVRVVNG